MKRVFSLLIAIAAIAMVGCCGTPKSDKGAAETKAATEECCPEAEAKECEKKCEGAEACEKECEGAEACEKECEGTEACEEATEA